MAMEGKPYPASTPDSAEVLDNKVREITIEVMEA
jgi:hypothetical protein